MKRLAGRRRAPRFPSEICRRRVPLGAEMLEIVQSRDIDRLIGRMTPTELADEKIPYYGQLWPAGIGLGRWVWRRLDLRGRDALDLGCGVGFVGIAAAKKGARVVFADYFQEALDLAKENAGRNGCPGHEFLRLDWRDERFHRPFDVILASDILYELRNHEPVYRFLLRNLKPDGIAVISDPGRPNSAPFFGKAGEGFLREIEEIEVQEGEARVRVSIARLSLART